MANSSSEFEENFKPVCHGSPHSLLELASTKMALNIWLPKFNEFYSFGNDSYIKIIELNFNIEISIAIPLKIKKIINSRILPISLELDRWADYMKQVQKTLSYDHIYTRLNLVSFGGNGTVHFKDTIANFLDDDSLDNMTRFEMACLNCMEEKINTLWPLVSHTFSIDSRFDNEIMLMRYWFRRQRGELDLIPLHGFNCIERRMIDKCRRRSIHLALALEYFITSLNHDDQLAELDPLFNPNHGEDGGDFRNIEIFLYRKNTTFASLFPNIDGFIQRQILDKYTTRIFTAFVVCSRPIEYAVQCFLHIRNIITPESYCSEVIINSIGYFDKSSNRIFFNLRGNEKNLRYEQIEIILEQIWINTPTRLKEYVLEYLSTILDQYNVYRCGHWVDFGRYIKFLLVVLSDANVQLRNSVWIKYWPDWIRNIPPCQFEELMGLCLRTTEAVEEFKSTLPNTEVFRMHCNRLVCKGRLIEFGEFLSSLYSDPGLVLNIIKTVLTNTFGIVLVTKNREEIENHAKYIDSLFSDEVLAAEFKDDLIFSDRVLRGLFHRGFITHDLDKLSDVEFVVSLFVSPQKHAEIKNRFLQLFRDMVAGGELHPFDDHLSSEFLMWCSDNNEQQINDFKNSIQIDIAFEMAFSKCLKYDRRIRMVASLARFLVWYFNSKSMAKNFICQRVEYYEGMDATDIERIFGRDKQYVVHSLKRYDLSNT